MPELPPNRQTRRFFAWKLAGACCFTAAFLVPLPAGNPRWNQLFDLSHVLVFATMACVLMHTLRETSPLRRAAMAISIVMAVGVVIEIVQPLVGRRASYQDMAYDLIGAVLGVTVAMSLRLARVN